MNHIVIHPGGETERTKTTAMYPQTRILTGRWRFVLGAISITSLLIVTEALLGQPASPIRWIGFGLTGLLLTTMAAWLLWRYFARQLGEELKQRDKSFQELLVNTSDLILVTDNQGGIKYVSPSATQITGHATPQLVGNSLYKFVHSGDLPDVQSVLQKLTLSCGQPLHLEFRLRHANGNWQSLQAVGHSFFIWGAQQFIALNARNQTETRKLQEELQRARTQVGSGQSVRSAAHDINNTLAVIQMRLDLLKQSNLSPATLQESLDAIEKASRRAANLTRQLLTPNHPPEL